jgi:hypothetical protein
MAAKSSESWLSCQRPWALIRLKYFAMMRERRKHCHYITAPLLDDHPLRGIARLARDYRLGIQLRAVADPALRIRFTLSTCLRVAISS